MIRALTIILLLFCLKSFAQDTLTVYYNDSWKEVSKDESPKYYRKAYKAPDGLWIATDYYMSGKIQMKGTYKSLISEKREGLFTYFYENGKMEAVSNYKNNYLEGESKYWNDKGILELVQIYKKNKLMYEKRYYSNGNLFYEGGYTFNKKDGYWQYYNHDGRLIFEGYYDRGYHEGEWKRTYPDTVVKINYVRGFTPIKGAIYRKRVD